MTIYGFHDDVTVEDVAAQMRAVLVGRSVVAVRNTSDRDKYAEGEVLLDDGTVLVLGGNDGCGGCAAGNYHLSLLNAMPVNGIMDVQVDSVDTSSPHDEWDERDTVYRVFVLAQDDRIRLAEFEGTDGNGYYGTGFWFKVVAP